MQSVADRRTLKALVALRKMQEREAIAAMSAARRALDAAERDCVVAKERASREQTRLERARDDSATRTAGRLALRERLRSTLREQSRLAETKRVEAVRALATAERALGRAQTALEQAHQARKQSETTARELALSERRTRDRRAHRAVEDRRR